MTDSDTDTLIRDIDSACYGQRLDQALADTFPEYSRSKLQTWLKQGRILVNGESRKARDKVMGGEHVSLEVEEEVWTEDEPQAIPLDIVYEDDALLVVNKPAGMVVHPGAGNRDKTLVNALLHHHEALSGVPRAGVVHRLDKDTTGLLVVAKTLSAHKALVDQLQERAFAREYEALVNGVMTAGGTVETFMGRHPVDRKRQAVLNTGGKEAITHYRVGEKFRAHTLVKVKLETGRTHQIRVHMAHLRYPLVGDPVYGGRPRLPKGASQDLIKTLQGFKRQALHARLLGLEHPDSGEWMEWEAPRPADMQHLVDALSTDLDEYDG